MKTRIFVVFHRAFDEGVFERFTPEEVERWFVRYAVNERHPKLLVGRDGERRAPGTPGSPDCVLEYRQAVYLPELQERGFMETSCYVHVEANGLAEGADVVGVCQYDMRWTDAAAQLLRRLAQRSLPARYAFGIPVGEVMAASGAMHPLAFAHLRNWRFLLDHYNAHFGTTWPPAMLVGKPLTLYQTYLLPRDEFASLAQWLRRLCADVYPWACQPPYETHWGSLGGYTERAASVFIAARLQERRFEFVPLPLLHDEGIAASLGVTKDHYGPGS